MPTLAAIFVQWNAQFRVASADSVTAIEVRAAECFELGFRRPGTTDIESESITDKTSFTLTARVRKK